MTARAKQSKPRRDVEAEVTAKVIEALERGTVPWSKPWTSRAGSFPTSFASGRAYRGINVWLLSMSAQAGGYSSPYWLTFNQAQERGGSVRNGEKGTLVVFWKILEVRDAESDEPRKLPMMRHYVVFNLEQTDDVAVPPRYVVEESDEPEQVDALAEEIVADVLAGYVDGPDVQYVAGNSAAYSPDLDVIRLPQVGQFHDGVGFASTAFHEVVHSTGHASRLDRFARNGEPRHFGSERYAREELVAEMGSAMLRALTGIGGDVEQSAAYVANWLGALRNDKSLVIRAAQQAQKAIDRIVGAAAENGEEAAA